MTLCARLPRLARAGSAEGAPRSAAAPRYGHAVSWPPNRARSTLLGRPAQEWKGLRGAACLPPRHAHDASAEQHDSWADGWALPPLAAPGGAGADPATEPLHGAWPSSGPGGEAAAALPSAGLPLQEQVRCLLMDAWRALAHVEAADRAALRPERASVGQLPAAAAAAGPAAAEAGGEPDAAAARAAEPAASAAAAAVPAEARWVDVSARMLPGLQARRLDSGSEPGPRQGCLAGAQAHQLGVCAPGAGGVPAAARLRRAARLMAERALRAARGRGAAVAHGRRVRPARPGRHRQGGGPWCRV